MRVPGFRASGVHCGIKPEGLDLALIASDVPAAVAGVFTRSTVVGAPVEWCRERVRSGRVQLREDSVEKHRTTHRYYIRIVRPTQELLY